MRCRAITRPYLLHLFDNCGVCAGLTDSFDNCPSGQVRKAVNQLNSFGALPARYPIIVAKLIPGAVLSNHSSLRWVDALE